MVENSKYVESVMLCVTVCVSFQFETQVVLFLFYNQEARKKRIIINVLMCACWCGDHVCPYSWALRLVLTNSTRCCFLNNNNNNKDTNPSKTHTGVRADAAPAVVRDHHHSRDAARFKVLAIVSLISRSH